MYNIEEIITEKYLEGKLDDDKFIALYSEADAEDYAADYLKTSGLAVGTAICNLANKKTHNELIEKYKETVDSYKTNIKDAKHNISIKRFAEAKRNINDAKKDIEACEKIIKNSDDGFLAWLSQHAAGNFNDIWIAVIPGCLAALATSDIDVGRDVAAITYFVKKLTNIVNIINYNGDAKGLGNVLNKQRANMLASLNYAKKQLDKLEKKIPRE